MSEWLEKCPLCGSGELQDHARARDRHYGIAGEYTVSRCAACSLVFLNPMYTDAELSRLYPTDYYAYQDNFNSSRWKEVLRRVMGMRIHTKDPRFEKPGKVLDVGCGSGWFLKEMANAGWQVKGVEVSSQAAAVGKAEGLDIFAGTLVEAALPSEEFDYVRANHSFEHITEPRATLREMHRVLKPEGRLMVGVPNIDGMAARLFGTDWWYFGAPVHPFNYSARTLRKLLEDNGFEVEKVAYNSDFSGLLGSLQIRMNRGSNKRSSEGWAFHNPLLKLLAQWTAKGLDAVKSGDAIEVTARKKAA